MLFNSYTFLFGFLPLALLLTYGTRRWLTLSKLTLTLLSLGFYAWWNVTQLPILLWSIVFNYWVGARIQVARAAARPRAITAWLTLGVLADLALLGWFKYANFVVDNVNLVTSAHLHLARIALPLAISFFTFQKLAYLIDSARGEAWPMRPVDFTLFAAFFPQLISGPIVHYKEVVPQILSKRFARFDGRNTMVGLVILAIGLFKKTVIADSLAYYSDRIFNVGVRHGDFGPMAGWIAAISFTLQVYFDFSGYSDMAIGLGRMFTVKLPLNFHSPLRAASIIDYWRRWHMTLQRFVVAYIFQPLSVPLTRLAAMRRLPPWPSFALSVAAPSFVTFVAVGVWHGAGWTYVLYGVMHACYICVNQLWRELRVRRRRALRRQKRVLAEPGPATLFGYRVVTLLAVLFSNVMFRARRVGDAFSIWRAMLGLGGGVLDHGPFAGMSAGLLLSLALGLFVVFLMPNTQQIMGRFDPAQNWAEWKHVGRPILSWTWTPSLCGLLFAAVTLFFGVAFIERGRAVFLYFNF